jgi:hypothetical protein
MSEQFVIGFRRDIPLAESALNQIEDSIDNFVKFNIDVVESQSKSIFSIISFLDKSQCISIDLDINANDKEDIIVDISRLRMIAERLLRKLDCYRKLKITESSLKHQQETKLFQQNSLELTYGEIEATPPSTQITEIMVTFISMTVIITSTFANEVETISNFLGFSNLLFFQSILLFILLLISKDTVRFLQKLAALRAKRIRKNMR